MNLPLLPTAIVGSYAMPGWLERMKTDYFARRISALDRRADYVIVKNPARFTSQIFENSKLPALLNQFGAS